MSTKRGEAPTILFLGAGASRAFGFSTTQEFLDLLKGKLHGKENALLVSLTTATGIGDIEHVLDILDQVVLGDNPFVKYLQYHQVKMSVSYTPVAWNEFKEIASSLRERIRVELFTEYEFLPEMRERIQQRLETLLTRIESESVGVMNVFTTNYDSVIERGLAGSRKFEVVDGFREVQGDPAEWGPDVFDSAPSQGKIRVNLFKLHGSLSWRTAKKTGKILRVDTEEKAVVGSKRFGENLLLYPASKIPPIKEPFGTLHTYLTRKLFLTRTCFVIGFSFRDPYLNTVFTDFLRREPSNILCVISPSAEESVQNLFENATPEEMPMNLIQQVVTRQARFEDPDTEGMILAVLRQQGQSQ